jgi:hypothetical protein
VEPAAPPAEAPAPPFPALPPLPPASPPAAPAASPPAPAASPPAPAALAPPTPPGAFGSAASGSPSPSAQAAESAIKSREEARYFRYVDVMSRGQIATGWASSSRAAWGGALLLALLTDACATPGTPPRRALGEPTPSASTSAEPLWLRSR